MKKLFYLFAVLSIVACKKTPHDYVTISGEITNLKVDTLTIYGNNRYIKKILVKKDGSFSDTLKIEAGFFALSDGKSQTFLNLKNGYELELKADADKFEESIVFEGDGAGTNNYLAKKINTQKQFGLDNLETFFLMEKSVFDAKIKEIDDFNTKLLAETKDLDSAFTANEKTANERMVVFLNQNYEAQHLKLTKFALGQPSPTFDLENFKGGKTSLKSLAGKYVYIDVWATWCAPCIQQIPDLKKVEEQYRDKNIAFVSLSIDKLAEKTKWRNMIKEKVLGGIQLFGESDWNSKFVKDYEITGIPRFILIDPQGNIVDANAPRPSDPRLIALFDSLKL